MNTLDKQYQELLQDVMENGTVKTDRTGTGTRSVFGRTIRHNMSEGFPLLTTKKMYWKGIVTELLWFLRGRTDLRWLLKHGNKIWVGDCYKAYRTYCEKNKEFMMDKWFTGEGEILTEGQFMGRILLDDEFNEEWGDLGKVYGFQWRKCGGNILEDGRVTCGYDQIKNVIRTLEANPDSRRMVVNAWAPQDLDEMVLPPCHYSFQFYTRELSVEERLNLSDYKNISLDEYSKYIAGDYFHGSEYCDHHNIPSRAISMSWNQRSVDFPLGFPFNIASYSLLLQLVANQVNMVPEEVIGNLGDTHIYLNQTEGVEEQISREVKYKLPKVEITGDYDLKDPEKTPLLSQIKLVDYQSDDTIHFPLSN